MVMDGGNYGKTFLNYFTKSKKSYKDLLTIRKIFMDTKSLHYSLKQIKDRIDKAEKAVRQLNIKNNYKKAFWDSLISFFVVSKEIAKKYNIPFKLD